MRIGYIMRNGRANEKAAPKDGDFAERDRKESGKPELVRGVVRFRQPLPTVADTPWPRDQNV